MHISIGIGAAVAAALLLAPPAKADGVPVTLSAKDPGLLALGAGSFDFDHRNPEAEFRAEYRFPQSFYYIKPLLGVFGTDRSAIYAYFGLRADIVFADHYVVMPVAAMGYYDRGSGKDLGSHFEFKTGAEFAYRFDGGVRIGLAFDHISNAGITKKNPGEENLLLMFSLPLGFQD